MLAQAVRLDLDGVDAMTDAQFEAALDAVHEYYSYSGGQRSAAGLEAGRGPRSAADRRDDPGRVDYVGEPRRFAFFSAAVFLEELRVDGMPSVARASERQYDAALQRTNERMHNFALCRNLPAAARYRGPQCWSQRTDWARACFEPTAALRAEAAEGTAGAHVPELGATANEGFLVLQCGLCARWRRVDLDTWRVYNDDAWRGEAAAARRDALFAEVPGLDGRFERWYTSLPAEHVLRCAEVAAAECGEACVAALDDGFWRQSSALRALRAARPRAALEFLLERVDVLRWDDARVSAAGELRGPSNDSTGNVSARLRVALQEALLARLAASMAEDGPGPRLRCEDLVDTACTDFCDWSGAFERPHSFAALRHLGYEVVFVKDAVDPDAQQVWSATFVSRSGGVVAVRPALLDVADGAVIVEATVAASTVRACCPVVGCGVSAPVEQPLGWSYVFRGRARTVLLEVAGLCNMHVRRLERSRRSPTLQKRLDLWTAAELAADSARACEFRAPDVPDMVAPVVPVVSGSASAESVLLRVMDGAHVERDARYGRAAGDAADWALAAAGVCGARAPSSWWPERARLCPESRVPLRTCRVRATFRRAQLRRVLDVQRVLGNLVLFCCDVCRERFPAFHPDCPPPAAAGALDVLATCPTAVASWREGCGLGRPGASERNAPHAPLRFGVCVRCAADLRTVQDDPDLHGIGKFSAANLMDPLMGYPDDVAVRRELDRHIEQATVVEAMLVALNHMQVSVCYLRTPRQQRTGMTCFRKNIISFPQEVLELRQLETFVLGLRPGDVVNVRTGAADGAVARARLLREVALPTRERGWMAEVAGEAQPRAVRVADLTQRVRLPWRPRDLHDYLIVFRRRDGDRNDYVEDLRVRRHLVLRLLQLLSKQGCWRPAHGLEPMHLYYSDFEWLSEEAVAEALPEDEVPADLNFQPLDDSGAAVRGGAGLSRDEFVDWLHEGRFSLDCVVAHALLTTWTSNVAACGNDSVEDLFAQLRAEARRLRRAEGDAAAVAAAGPSDESDDEDEDDSQRRGHGRAAATLREVVEADDGGGRVPRLSLAFLGRYVAAHGRVSCQLRGTTPETVALELAEMIAEEVAGVRAYLSTFRSSGVFTAPPRDTVADELGGTVEEAVHPWPRIAPEPAPERSDGRFVKSFPLEFPMGVGDLRQSRCRSDFSAADWAQHLFRYHDGRFLRSLRGHRVVWAIFNSVLREQAYATGRLVHKSAGQEVLTKDELCRLVADRQDLVRRVASFGADVPTTPLHWKREGHNLEWIVRQMSWLPPWYAPDESDLARRLPRRENTSVVPATAAAAGFAVLPITPDGEAEGLDGEHTPDDEERRDAGSDGCSSSGDSQKSPSEDGNAEDGDDGGPPPEPRSVRQRQSGRPATRAETPHPRDLWCRFPTRVRADTEGYGRAPAFWYTLNCPYNYLYEIHRFHRAAAALAAHEVTVEQQPGVGDGSEHGAEGSAWPLLDRDGLRDNARWVLDNPDIVAFVHALRVELNARVVLRHVVPEDDPRQPFQFWLRFEYGSGGNPHAHGIAWVARNPSFECVVPDEETREQLICEGHRDAMELRTAQEATRELAAFYGQYVRESHPAKDLQGAPLYDLVVENVLRHRHLARPQSVRLLPLLENLFADEDAGREPDLAPLRELLVALIEDGQRHTSHGHRAPQWGRDACARKGRAPDGGREVVYCRYLFPRDLLVPDPARPAVVQNDPYRPGLRNLCLPRNDSLLNSFEEHVLLANLGNVDWRPLINLWSVLEYLTKYTAKAGKATKHVGLLFEDMVKRVVDFEEEDGVQDLWRRTIMKFYSQLLGNRDYSLLEVLHFGLRLPGVISSFGRVENVSVSTWASVRRGEALRALEPGQRCTAWTKLELFNRRVALTRPSTIAEQDLENLSFYQFWRLFGVDRQRLVRHHRDRVLSLSGTGWPAQARRAHAQHAEYARRTLYAYAPCAGLRGVEYLDEAVARHWGGSWADALYAFVSDPLNRFCPTWIRRNYDALNPDADSRRAARERARAAAPQFVFEESSQDPPLAEGRGDEVPAADRPADALLSGEPPVDETDALRPEAYSSDHHWKPAGRPAWQRHSELGPNLQCEGSTSVREGPEQFVNPSNEDYQSAWSLRQLELWRAHWEVLKAARPEREAEQLSRDALGDPFQQLFVDVVLDHAAEVLDADADPNPDRLPPAPLRLLLLGTAGTGKTTTVRTALQELRQLLEARGAPLEFVQVAAPTGSAAFQLKFSATTLHRLIQWFNPRHWRVLDHPDRLHRLQQAFERTQLIVIDEISMVGRKMLARIASRLSQARPGAQNPAGHSAGGFSLVGVGDPAQCPALFDQQLYDVDSHRRASELSTDAMLSNEGLELYREFRDVVVLTECHRVQRAAGDAATEEGRRRNERAEEFLRVLHAVRDVTLTQEQFYWLCRRKRAHLQLDELRLFEEAPVLMDFRRNTDRSAGENCEQYNRLQVRALARKQRRPVIAWDAWHEGRGSEGDGQHLVRLDDERFHQLPGRLELTVGARVLLLHNLCVPFGLMNGTQGTVVEIVYVAGDHPNHDEPQRRMPRCVLVDFPEFAGPPFFEDAERRTWVPLFPQTAADTEVGAAATGVSGGAAPALQRTQYPLTLAWALTTFKAQGMTLRRAVVRVDKAAHTPGVLFVALSRVRHPDDLMLHDTFPDYATIMRLRKHAAFQQRVAWERRQRVLFSRTVRCRMRQPERYPSELCWSAVEDRVATALLQAVRAARPTTTELRCDARATSSVPLPAGVAERAREILARQDATELASEPAPDHATLDRVWTRLQRFPHVFELADACGQLDMLELDGTPLRGGGPNAGPPPKTRARASAVVQAPTDEPALAPASGAGQAASGTRPAGAKRKFVVAPAPSGPVAQRADKAPAAASTTRASSSAVVVVSAAVTRPATAESVAAPATQEEGKELAAAAPASKRRKFVAASAGQLRPQAPATAAHAPDRGSDRADDEGRAEQASRSESTTVSTTPPAHALAGVTASAPSRPATAPLGRRFVAAPCAPPPRAPPVAPSGSSAPPAEVEHVRPAAVSQSLLKRRRGGTADNTRTSAPTSTPVAPSLPAPATAPATEADPALSVMLAAAVPSVSPPVPSAPASSSASSAPRAAEQAAFLVCEACDGVGHARETCPFFANRPREAHPDAQLGSSDRPHMYAHVVHDAQPAYRADGLVDSSAVFVNGRRYRVGYASGAANNCLLDTLRQKLSLVGVRLDAVRRELRRRFSEPGPAQVTERNFLELHLHWRDAVELLLQEAGKSEAEAHRMAENLCIVCIDLARLGMEAVADVVGHGRMILHIACQAHSHFVPLLPCLEA